MKLGTGLLALVAAALLLAGTGCANNKLTAERDSLASQNKELADQLKAERDARQLAESRATAMGGALTAAPSATPGVPDMGGPLDLTGPRARTSTPARPLSATPSKATTPAKVAAPSKVTIPGQVLFDSGKTTLNAAATKTLDTIAATIKTKYKGDKLVIEGYTDATPPAKNSVWKSNDELAQARATAVKKYLVKKGIADADMTVKGAVDTTNTKNPALSRRAEVAVLAAK
jgi:outer membrane protein OmpA-like peptidoglycan-associated protein